MTNPVAERVRRIGGIAQRSIEQITRRKRTAMMRPLRDRCGAFGDVTGVGALER